MRAPATWASPWPRQRTLDPPTLPVPRLEAAAELRPEGLHEVKDAEFLHPLHVLLDPHDLLVLVVPNHLHFGCRQQGRWPGCTTAGRARFLGGWPHCLGLSGPE